MSKMLAIVSAVSLLLCAALLGLAHAIGGDDVFHDQRSLGRIKPLIDLATHKEWHWDGGDTLALDTPVNIRYQPQGAPHVSVTGPAELMQHVRVGGGRIGSDTAAVTADGKRLEAVVSGVAIRRFVVNGGESLQLGHIDQPGLDLFINGNGAVSGDGKVSALKLVISGTGKADLGGLSVGDAKVSILGSGTATLSPHGDVQLLIAGSGKLGLLTRPAHLRQTILGSGDVSQTAAGADSSTSSSSSSSSSAAAAKASQERIAQDVPQPTTPPAVTMMDGGKNGAVIMRGDKDIDLGHVEQKSLTVTVANSGSATAEGKVDTLNVTVLGSGHADLGKVAARKVIVAIMGNGAATVAPGEELKVTIMGSGDVHLLTKPARIERNILGSGQIVEAK
jgi:Putative auto-transporter adhesin, head GIN domain